MRKQVRKWEEDNRVGMSSESIQTPRKNECVVVCVCLYLCVSEKGDLESLSEAPHQTVREKALLIACWCEGRDLKEQKKERKSTVLISCIIWSKRLSQHHRDPRREALQKTFVSKSLYHLLQALQHEHCNGNTCPPGGAVSPGTKWGCASLIWFQLYLQNQR